MVVLFGTNDDTFYGYSGPDALFGYALSDNLFGGSGDDQPNSSSGFDDINSDGGGDFLDYLKIQNGIGVFVGLSGGIATGEDTKWDTFLEPAGVHGAQFENTLFGTNGADTIYGGPGSDLIKGRGGPDELFGDAGNDKLFGGSGDDRLNGGSGSDDIDGGDGVDILDYLKSQSGVGVFVDLLHGSATGGDAEGDTFSGIEGVHGSQFGDTLLGTNGVDSIYGGPGSDLIKGRGGDDFLMAGSLYHPGIFQASYNTRIFGGGGNDTIWGDNGTAKISGGNGNDLIYYGKLILGGAGDDTIYVSSGETQVFGGTGHDLIFDSYKRDEIDAGDGNDIVVMDGLHGTIVDGDTVLLGDGNDLLHVQMKNVPRPAVSSMDGGDGFDTLALNFFLYNGFGGRAEIDFRTQDDGSWLNLGGFKVRNFEQFYLQDTDKIDLVHFGHGNDVFIGGGYTANTVYGHGGDDFLKSGSTGNYLFGGGGNDRIVADGGTATGFHRAFGGPGDDMLFGFYADADYHSRARLNGGDGADGFIFVDADHIQSEQADIILDFDVTEDWIGLSFASYHPLDPPGIAIDAMTTQSVSLVATVLVDDGSILRFLTESVDKYGISHSHTVTYVQDKGRLKVSTDGSNAELIAIIKGGPELTMAHFYGMSAVAESDQLLDTWLSVATDTTLDW